MKKLFTVLSAVLFLGIANAQQTAPASKMQKMNPKAETKMAKPAMTAKPAMAVKPAAPAGVKMKKDGTPDKRYKTAQHLKKDGTPDKRYKK